MVQIHQLTLQYRYKLITNVRSSLMAVNIHITIIELNALHTKRQNLFQELDAVIHLLMEAKHWRSEERFSRNAETDLVCRLLLEKKNWTARRGRSSRDYRVCSLLFGLHPATTEIYTLSLHDALPILQTHHERQKQPYGRQHTYHHYRTQRPAYEKTESLPRA